MADSGDYRRSKNTEIKQVSFRSFVGWHIDICQAIWASKNWYGPQYVYIDLHGGPGVDCEGKDGSPRIFTDVAQSKGLNYRGLVYERNPDTYNTLVSNITDLPNLIAVNDDHNTVSQGMNDCLYRSNRKWTFGIVYCDPSNAQIPIEPLRAIIRRFPKLEIVINLAAASYKRQRNIPSYQELGVILTTLKEKWIIRKPVDKFQWTILAGTSYKSFPEWQARGFYAWDSDVGQDWYQRITMTASELRDKYQPGLFDE